MKAPQPFPKIPTFLAAMTVLEYFGNILTCKVMLNRLSKKTRKYSKAHNTELREALEDYQTRAKRFHDRTGYGLTWRNETAEEQIRNRQQKQHRQMRTRDLWVICFENVE